MMKGTVSWWNDCKGFGFIKGEDEEDYFAHFSAITTTKIEFKTLMEGEEVTFNPLHTPKGKVADRIIRSNVPVEEIEVVKNCPCCESKASYFGDKSYPWMHSPQVPSLDLS